MKKLILAALVLFSFAGKFRRRRQNGSGNFKEDYLQNSGRFLVPLNVQSTHRGVLYIKPIIPAGP